MIAKENQGLELGVIKGEHINDYHGNDAISSSGVKSFISNPRSFYGEYISKEYPSSFDPEIGKIGNAFHCMCLEGMEQFNKEYRVSLENEPKEPTKLMWSSYEMGKAKPDIQERCEYWTDLLNDTRDVIKQKDMDMLRNMLNGVKDNEPAMDMLVKGEPEVGFRMEHEGNYLQCRTDCLVDKGDSYIVLDAKTTSSPIEDVSKAIVRYRYDIQAAFYKYVIEQVQDKKVSKFCFLFVEKKPPYQNQLVTLDMDIIDAQMDTVRELIDGIISLKAMDKPKFPAPSVTFSNIASNWELRELGVNDE